MPSFNIEFNDTALQAAFKQLIERGTNLRQLLLEIGGELKRTTRENFDNEQSPDGVKWQPLNADYAARKAAGKISRGKGKDKHYIAPSINKTLHFALDLRDAFDINVGKDDLEVSTNVLYARVHQLGGGKNKIPARPFLGVSADNKNFIAEAAADYLTGSI